MKIKAILISFVVFFSVLILTISCSQKNTKWKGTIEKIDGVTIVKNPKEPIYGELVFDLEGYLSIGREDDENYLFNRTWNISIDSKSNILVLDSGNRRIQKFNQNGEFLSTIGRKGEGPGEFSNPTNFSLDMDDNVYVYDSRKLKIFNKNGEPLKEIALKNYISDFAVTTQKNIIALIYQYLESGKYHTLSKLDDKGNSLKMIKQFQIGYHRPVRKSGERTISLRIDHPYTNYVYLTSMEDRIFVFGESLKYELFAVNEGGDFLMRIKKEAKKVPITRKERDRVRSEFKYLEKRWTKDVVDEAVQFPPHRPFFNEILADDKGRIYIKKVKSVLDKSKKIEFDIFSKEGCYLYMTKLPFSPEIIQNGYLYDIYTSRETGEIRIKKYMIKNWQQIKEGI